MVTDVRRFVVQEVIGQGSFGTVYRARLEGARGFSKVVALKILNPELAQDADFGSRLRDEARMLAMLRHRAVVRVEGLVEVDGRQAVVMELVEGMDLERLLRFGPVPAVAAAEIAAEVAGALHVAYVHPSSSGRPLRLLHRDLKPANLVVAPTGDVKILDFGVARAEFAAREALTGVMACGSAGYVSPERLDLRDGPEGDVYALGAVLFEMITGSKAGNASMRRERHEARVGRALSELRRTLGDAAPELESLVGEMLAYDPGVRPTAREVERRCRAIPRLLDGEGLRDWAERVVVWAISRSSGPHRDERTGEELAAVVDESGGSWTISDPDAPVDEQPTVKNPVLDHIPGEGIEGAAERSVRWGLAAGVAVMALLFVVLVRGLLWEFGHPAGPGPVPQVEEREEPIDGPSGVVRVEGDARSFWLVGEGRRLPPGRVPAGTYNLLVSFGRNALVGAGQLTVVDGESVTVECDGAWRRCVVR